MNHKCKPPVQIFLRYISTMSVSGMHNTMVFAFLSFVHNSGNYAFIVSHDFQAEKIAARRGDGRCSFGGFVYLVSLQYSGPGLG